MIARNAQTIIAIAAILTFLVIALVPAASGLYWLVQLNSKVDYLQAEMDDTQQDVQDVRQEVQGLHQDVQDIRQEVQGLHQDVGGLNLEVKGLHREVQDTRRELLEAIEQSENRILDALANHSHDERGNAIFTRPVSASGQPGTPTSPPRQ